MVARSVDPDLDAEALRVLQTMLSGSRHAEGKIVRVKFTVPVSYSNFSKLCLSPL